jgi:Flp pilus assembly protein TadD
MSLNLVLRALVLTSASVVAITFAYAAGDARLVCDRPVSLEARLHSHPDAKSYGESAAWFASKHNFQCAVRDYRSAVKLDPSSAHLLLLLGENLVSANDLKEAETALRSSISIAPEIAEAHEQLAIVLERLQRRDEARSEWAAVLKIDPKSITAFDGMARHLLENGDYPAVVELLRSAPDSEVLTIDLAHAYAQGGSLPDAEAVLRKAVSKNPESFPLTRSLIGVLVDEHLYERTFQEPARLAEQFAASHPDNLEAQRLYLQLLVAWIPQGAQTGEVARATPLARKLLASHPRDPYFLYVNGMLERQAGDYKNAKDHLEKSVALDPKSEHAHYELGMALAGLNDAAGAKREFLKTLDLGNQEPEVRFQLAKALRTLGEATEANRQLKLYSDEMAAASQKRVAILKEGQANKALASGNTGEAITFFRQALEATPDSAMLHFKLAMALDKTGDTAGEKAALEKAVQIDPDMAIAQNQLGYLASRMGDAASAEQHFRQAVRAAPAYAEAWVNLAATLGMESKIPEAQQAVASALKADPNNASALQLQQELSSEQH